MAPYNAESKKINKFIEKGKFLIDFSRIDTIKAQIVNAFKKQNISIYNKKRYYKIVRGPFTLYLSSLKLNEITGSALEAHIKRIISESEADANEIIKKRKPLI